MKYNKKCIRDTLKWRHTLVDSKVTKVFLRNQVRL